MRSSAAIYLRGVLLLFIDSMQSSFPSDKPAPPSFARHLQGHHVAAGCKSKFCERERERQGATRGAICGLSACRHFSIPLCFDGIREYSTAISPPSPASVTSSGFGPLVPGKRNSVRGRNSLSWGVRRNGFLGSGVAALRNSAKLSGNSVYSARENSNLAGGFCKASLDALTFDCDGVILESEDLHRPASNLTFEHFSVKSDSKLVDSDTEFYDVLQNTVGGGKPKMRWYFGKNGWPTSTVFGTAPESDEDRSTLTDTLQALKEVPRQKFRR
ncbi:hypothetical protein R1sor_019454 [Riccia sorocarpa]|uniref:Uncharacterized protein n=1 Tax=Riccia sorocarpa TaxID=122646 RepID=A0ABD3ICQ0_9MARC